MRQLKENEMISKENMKPITKRRQNRDQISK